MVYPSVIPRYSYGNPTSTYFQTGLNSVISPFVNSAVRVLEGACNPVEVGVWWDYLGNLGGSNKIFVDMLVCFR